LSASEKYSFLEAKQKIESFCAYQERCESEVRTKLFSLGQDTENTDILIAHLISFNFLNEERFAQAFASGKFRIKGWGKIKIKAELKSRRISNYSINVALNAIDSDEYRNTIYRLANTKAKLVKAKSLFDKKIKVTRYLTGKGFELDLVQEVLNEVLQ